MNLTALLLLCAIVAPSLAAKAQQGPPAECEKPFGEGKLATDASPYKFKISSQQRDDDVDYKKTFKGAPVELTIQFTRDPSAPEITGFALRAGIPFPVVQWLDSQDPQSKIVSCIAPRSIDTYIIQGTVDDTYKALATPLLAAWSNKNSLPVTYEMAIKNADNKIYVASFNGTMIVRETDYTLPKEFFQPPPSQAQGQGQGTRPQMSEEQFREFLKKNNMTPEQFMKAMQSSQHRQKREVEDAVDQSDEAGKADSGNERSDAGDVYQEAQGDEPAADEDAGGDGDADADDDNDDHDAGSEDVPSQDDKR